MANAMEMSHTRFSRWYNAFRQSRYYSRFSQTPCSLPSGITRGPGTPFFRGQLFSGALLRTGFLICSVE